MIEKIAPATPNPSLGCAVLPWALSAWAYVLVTLISLLIGIGLLLFYVYKVPELVRSRAQNQIFYLLLIPWALACAAFLFGAMKSYARLSHKHLGSYLELGGPVVLFCLVVAGGFKLVPGPVTTENPGFRCSGFFAVLRFQLAAGDGDGGIVWATSVPRLTGVGSWLVKVPMAEKRNVRLCLMMKGNGGGARGLIRQRLSRASLVSVV